MFETNLIKHAKYKQKSIYEYLKAIGKRSLIYDQYTDIMFFLPNESKFLERDIKRFSNKDVDYAVLFPAASYSDSSIFAITYKRTNQPAYSNSIKDIDKYIQSIKNFIRREFGFIISKEIEGKFEISSNSALIQGNSISAAIWLTIFLTNFAKKIPDLFCITGEVDFDNFLINKITLIENKKTAFEREFLNKKRIFIYNAEENINDSCFYKVKNINDCLNILNFNIDTSKLTFNKKDLLIHARNLEKNNFFRAKELYDDLKLNYNLDEIEETYYLMYYAHYYNKLGELDLAAKFYNQVNENCINSYSELISKFYSRKINLYFDTFELDKVKNVITKLEKIRHYDDIKKIKNFWGHFYYLINQTDTAINHYLEAIDTSETIGVLRSKNYLLNAYLKKKDFSSAKQIVEELINSSLIDNYNIYYILKFFEISKTTPNLTMINQFKPTNSYIDMLILSYLKYNFFNIYKKYIEYHNELRNSNIFKNDIYNLIFTLYESYYQSKSLTELITLIKKSDYYKKYKKFQVYLENILRDNIVSAPSDLLTLFIWI